MSLERFRYGLILLGILWLGALAAVAFRGEAVRREVQASPCVRAYLPGGTVRDLDRCEEVLRIRDRTRPAADLCIPLERVLTPAWYYRATICRDLTSETRNRTAGSPPPGEE